MPDFEKIVKDVMYGGLGAAATLMEKGGELAQNLVDKGRETMRNNQGTVDEIQQKLQEFCDALMNRGEIDVSKLTPEQRAELRHQLEEMDYPNGTEDEKTAEESGVTDDAEPVMPEADKPTEATYRQADDADGKAD